MGNTGKKKEKNRTVIICLRLFSHQRDGEATAFLLYTQRCVNPYAHYVRILGSRASQSFTSAAATVKFMHLLLLLVHVCCRSCFGNKYSEVIFVSARRQVHHFAMTEYMRTKRNDTHNASWFGSDKIVTAIGINVIQCRSVKYRI